MAEGYGGASYRSFGFASGRRPERLGPGPTAPTGLSKLPFQDMPTRTFRRQWRRKRPRSTGSDYWSWLDRAGLQRFSRFVSRGNSGADGWRPCLFRRRPTGRSPVRLCTRSSHSGFCFLKGEGEDRNNRGEIVGTATNSAGTESSFFYRGHSFEKIPLVAAGLNNSGHIAGTYTAASGSSHAALYRDGRLIDVNDLVDPSLTFLINASGISDNGHLVASGLNGHLYVLTPK
jgi:probable HAF family extracellular repeat protein